MLLKFLVTVKPFFKEGKKEGLTVVSLARMRADELLEKGI